MTQVQINQLITLFVIFYLVFLAAGLRVYFLTIEIAEYKKIKRLYAFEYLYLTTSIIPVLNTWMFFFWLFNSKVINDFKYAKKHNLHYKTVYEKEHLI